MDDVLDLLEYLPDEVRKKCLELQQFDSHYQEKMNKLKVDSTNFFAALKDLTPLEREKINKEMHQRYQECRDIAEEKVQIAEYLQSVLEKYQERVMKDLSEFKADLESENPAEVELIEKAFMQSVTSPNTQNDAAAAAALFLNEDDLQESMPSTSAISILEGPANISINGNGHGMEGTPKSHHHPQQRLKQQQPTYDDFKIPANFRRPSIDSRTQSQIFDEDIFDAEFSPPVKRPKPAPPQRQLAISSAAVAHSSTKSSREASPHSSISSSSPRSTPPLAAGSYPSSKFPFHPPRFPSIESTSSHASTYRQKHEGGTGGEEQLLMSSQRQSAAMMRMPSFAGAQPSRHGRPRKLLTKKVEQMLIGKPRHVQGGPSTSAVTMAKRKRRRRLQAEEQGIGEDFGEEEEEEEYEEDEGEEGEEEEEADDKAWCYCKQGSAGEMVACDNKNCPYEWFHYECVGITQPPKGRWYCPTCSMKMNADNRSRSASFDQQPQH